MNRRFLSIVLIAFIILTSTASYGKININSKSSLLMDYHSGKILYAKNENERLAPASITKIMTLLIAMESIDSNKIKLTDEVQISKHASSMGGTQVYLDAGEIQTVENLIKSISIRSANDSSVALAEYISGSEEAFVKEMNKRAKQLKMENTHFSNSSGLPTENHYSSALDIAIMSRELLKHSDISSYLSTYMEDIKVGKSKSSTQTMVNTNRLIKDYDGANGIKTGFTSEALFCIAASAKRDNLQLISVILGGENSKTRFEEAGKLLDYGFSNYESVEVGQRGDKITRLPLDKANKESIDIVLERDSNIIFPKGNKVEIETTIEVPEYIVAPIKKNAAIGKLIVRNKDEILDEINLITINEVNRSNLLNTLKKAYISFLTNN